MSFEFRCVAPSLQALDEAHADTLLITVTEDERPLQRVAGLVDWRLDGTLTKHCLSGFLTGQRGESALLSPRGKLPFTRLVVQGVGPSSYVNDQTTIEAMRTFMSQVADLSCRQAWVEVPVLTDREEPLVQALDESLPLLFRERRFALEKLVLLVPGAFHKALTLQMQRKLSTLRR